MQISLIDLSRLGLEYFFHVEVLEGNEARRPEDHHQDDKDRDDDPLVDFQGFRARSGD